MTWRRAVWLALEWRGARYLLALVADAPLTFFVTSRLHDPKQLAVVLPLVLGIPPLVIQIFWFKYRGAPEEEPKA